jgi:AbrB family looped-hinge helix DNA binding protein
MKPVTLDNFIFVFLKTRQKLIVCLDCSDLCVCFCDRIPLHLPVGVIPMQITSKGQVTIPQEVRNRLGLLPHTEVEFEVSGDHARIRKARRTEGSGVRGQKALKALRGSADTRMSTDEIMALTRGSRRAGANGK